MQQQRVTPTPPGAPEKNGVQLAFRSHQLAFKPEHKSSARFTLHKMSMAMELKLEMGLACEDSTVKCRVWSVGTALLCSVAFIERIIDGNDKTTLKDLPRATLKLHAKQRWLGLAWPGLAQRCRRTQNSELRGNFASLKCGSAVNLIE